MATKPTVEPVGRMPKTEKEEKFGLEYIKHYQIKKAAQDAGYSKEFIAKHVYKLPRRLAPYIAKLEAQKGKEMAKYIAIDQSEVLHLLSLVAKGNILDYIEMREVEVFKEGKPTKESRAFLKPLEALTRDQAAVIDKVFTNADGTLGYTLQNNTKALQLAMRHYGMLSESLIAEHLHKHLHLHADLRDMSTDKLVRLERALIEIIGPQAATAMGMKDVTPAAITKN